MAPWRYWLERRKTIKSLRVCEQRHGGQEDSTKDLPRPRKSTAGVEETAGLATGAVCFSSTDMFALPRRTEVGINGSEGFSSTLSSRIAEWEESSVSTGSSVSSSSSASSTVVVLTGWLGAVLNTKPGPRPPPRTLSGAGATGALFFGAGSIDNRSEAPAPESRRGFFAAGLSSWSEASPSVSFLRVGRPIAIFFGFLALGGGKDKPVLALDEEADPFVGGGRENVDFLVGAGSLAVKEGPVAVDDA